MNHSESTKNIFAALTMAQAKMPHAPFDALNPFLKNEYATLGSVIETAKPVLAEFKLAVTQLVVSGDNNNIGVETVLVHESGEWISEVCMISFGEEKGKSFAQVAGSVISYLRRYSFAAIIGLYADKDDDGNSVPEKKSVKEKKKEPEAKTELDETKEKILVLCHELGKEHEEELVKLVEDTIHVKNPKTIKELSVAKDLLEKLENMKKEKSQ
jgi:hypothetical protein